MSSVRPTRARFFLRFLPAVGVLAAAGAALALASATAAAPAHESGLSGGDLYGVHCARCHTERYPTERTDGQWQTIVMHMRVHAMLPGADAQKIVDYLKASN